MSKQDTHFLNVFSVVIGLLVAVALVLFAVARIIGNHTQVAQVHTDPSYVAELAKNIQPPERVAVAGQDNSALKIEAPAGAAAAPALAVPKDGKELFESVCKACHGAGIAGAPKAGDKAAWGPRIAQGKATLYEHAIKGFQGKAGVMPAKGARTDLGDDLVKQGVDYLISLAQ